MLPRRTSHRESSSTTSATLVGGPAADLTGPTPGLAVEIELTTAATAVLARRPAIATG